MQKIGKVSEKHEFSGGFLREFAEKEVSRCDFTRNRLKIEKNRLKAKVIKKTKRKASYSEEKRL